MVESEGIPLVPKVSGEVPRKGTLFSSVFVLTTCCVGAGTLSVAYAFSKGGLAFSIAVFLVIIFSSVMAAIEMLDAKQLYEEISKAHPERSVKVNSFPTLGEAAFGKVGKVSEWNTNLHHRSMPTLTWPLCWAWRALGHPGCKGVLPTRQQHACRACELSWVLCSCIGLRLLHRMLHSL